MGYHLSFSPNSFKVVSNTYLKTNSKCNLSSDLTLGSTESPPVVLFDLNDETKQCKFYSLTNLPIEDNGTDGKLACLGAVAGDPIMSNLSSLGIGSFQTLSVTVQHSAIFAHHRAEKFTSYHRFDYFGGFLFVRCYLCMLIITTRCLGISTMRATSKECCNLYHRDPSMRIRVVPRYYLLLPSSCQFGTDDSNPLCQCEPDQLPGTIHDPYEPSRIKLAKINGCVF